MKSIMVAEHMGALRGLQADSAKWLKKEMPPGYNDKPPPAMNAYLFRNMAALPYFFFPFT